MDMQGSRQLAITQQQAWDALNDPVVLKVCIPGCDKVEASGENQYSIAMALKVGPVAARFTGKIALSEINPPASYKLSFEGQGGVAGFGKGSAAVTLAPNADGCELAYTAQASVGGKIAQLGQRLIDGAAKSMAEDFFKRFDEEMQRQHPESYPAKMVMGDVSEAPTRTRLLGLPAWAWIAAAAVLALLAWQTLGQ
ncbi:MAG: carbon monoxide dehydrogenase [Burkholderiales bacterium RIFCSPHIGHO2_12_FULL_61_11]|nr:MAG: carbon monoxide dehydrogenase [Burkholderiales bacterium RIFCSPHIGHO2_12_FULL_61_11]